jgi:hypothetical protein
MYGVRSGYVVVICVRSARCTDDLTLLFEPGLMLHIDGLVYIHFIDD